MPWMRRRSMCRDAAINPNAAMNVTVFHGITNPRPFRAILEKL